ncbi:MAG: glycosyltransferase family 2 protein [Candidatus Berkelbacteria bacterium]
MDKRDKKLIRLFEILPGAFSWGTLIVLFLFAVFLPKVLAVFMIFYIIFWFIRVLFMSWRLVLGYIYHSREMAIDWATALTKLAPRDSWRKIYHIVLVPTYKEGLDILRTTVKSVEKTDYPNNRIIFILATEERDKDNVRGYAEILKKENAGKFLDFIVTEHPDNLPDEIKGKGPNITYSMKAALPIIDKLKVPYENIIVTNMDADHILDKKYLSCLTYKYLTTPDPTHKTFQPLPMFFNNLWDVPMPMRLIGMSSSFWQMIVSSRVSRLRNFSSHAQSLAALVITDFWAKDTIVEDGHQFWRSYFAFAGNHQVVPVFVPIYQDAILGSTMFLTIKEQYLQKKRWSWGVSDIPFVFYHAIKDKRIFWFDRLANCLILFESHWSWATGSLVLALFSWIPLVVNPQFGNSVLAYNFRHIYSDIILVAYIGMITTLTISTLLVWPRRKNKKTGWRIVFDWILTPIMLPITNIAFSSIPAFDSQTRLMFGIKPTVFRVTIKVRKNEASV